MVTHLVSRDGLDVAQAVLVRRELRNVLNQYMHHPNVALAESRHQTAHFTVILAVNIGSEGNQTLNNLQMTT